MNSAAVAPVSDVDWRSMLDGVEVGPVLWRDSEESEQRGQASGEGTCRREPAGEMNRRMRMLQRVMAALRIAFGDDRSILIWLRLPNAELHGEAPLARLAGPTRWIEQVAMRLERENEHRNPSR